MARKRTRTTTVYIFVARHERTQRRRIGDNLAMTMRSLIPKAIFIIQESRNETIFFTQPPVGNNT